MTPNRYGFPAELILDKLVTRTNRTRGYYYYLFTLVDHPINLISQVIYEIVIRGPALIGNGTGPNLDHDSLGGCYVIAIHCSTDVWSGFEPATTPHSGALPKLGCILISNGV